MADKGKKVDANPLELPYFGVESAPEIFVDGYHGVSVNNGVAKIHFFTVVYDPITEKMKRRAAFTMVAPIPVLLGISTAQNKLIEHLKADGLIVEVKEKEGSDA